MHKCAFINFMKNIGKRLKFLRGEMNYVEFAKLIETTRQNITRYENEEVIPGGEILSNICKKLNVNLNWLLTGEGEPYIKPEPLKKDKNLIPIFGSVECGKPIEKWEQNKITGYMQFPNASKYNNVFALIASGDSMFPYINEGDVLICADEPKKLKNGQSAVVVFKSVESVESNAKLIRFIDKDKILLYPLNTKYKIVTYELSEIYKIYPVIHIIREVKPL